MLRLPGWANGEPVPSDLYSYINKVSSAIKLYVNGVETSYTMDKGYMVLSREWNEGDKVTFSLPMDIHRTLASDKVEADKGRVELERGPIVYCLEWPDNDNAVQSCVLADDAKVDAEWTEDFNGVYDIKLVGAKASYDANGSVVLKQSTLSAIPYYAWDNRGSKGQMEVWIPRTVDFAEPMSYSTSSISNIKSFLNVDKRIYDLQGRQCSLTPTHKGVYISNGKKVILF